MEMAGYRIIVDFAAFFTDERRNSYLYIDCTTDRTVSDIQRRIQQMFHITDCISLVANGCFLHPEESVQILYEGDVVRVISTGSHTQKELVQEVIQTKHIREKRNQENEKDLEKEELKSNVAKIKKKKLSKYDTENNESTLEERDVSGNGCDTTSFISDSHESYHSRKKKRARAQLDVSVENMSPSDTNVMSKSKKSKSKKEYIKNLDEFENKNGNMNTPSSQMNLLSNNKHHSDCLNDDVTSTLDTEKNALVTEKEVPLINGNSQSGGPNEDRNPLDDVNFGNKKRRRRRKKHKEYPIANNLPQITECYQSDVPNGLSVNNRKHIRFADDERHENSCTKSAESNVLQYSNTQNEEVPEDEGISVQCGETNSKLVEHENVNGLSNKDYSNKSKEKDTSTKWNTSENVAMILPQNSKTRDIPMYHSTPIVFECKRPFLPSTENSTPKMSLKEPGDYSKYPLLQSLPRPNDILAFKVWRLAHDYTPFISGYIIGKVLQFYEPENQIKVKILEGFDELIEPDGKFSLNELPEGQEESNADCKVIEEFEGHYQKDMLDVRILFP